MTGQKSMSGRRDHETAPFIAIPVASGGTALIVKAIGE